MSFQELDSAAESPCVLPSDSISFENLCLPEELNKAIKRAGYSAPTPIQQRAIPLIAQGHDVLGLAQTGTGKTAAFVLPMLQKLMATKKRGLRALIIAPTRELAQQIDACVKEFLPPRTLRSAPVFGGVGMGPQIQHFRNGVEIIIACPGRLLDHIQQRTVNLSGVELLVLDEADQMFDMGFLPNIKRILSHVPANRQTLLFSATMPDEIRSLAAHVMKNPKVIEVGRISPVATVSHALYPVDEQRKAAALLDLINRSPDGSILVFTKTKHRAKRLAEQLKREGFSATSLQGNLSQNKRDRAMRGFRSGEYQILVATDIAARGLDISSVSHVINFDIPNTSDAYIHRIGRTGRAAKTGDASTLITREDLSTVRYIERALGNKIAVKHLSESPDAAALDIEQSLSSNGSLHRHGENRHGFSRRPGGQGGGRNGHRGRRPWGGGSGRHTGSNRQGFRQAM